MAEDKVDQASERVRARMTEGKVDRVSGRARARMTEPFEAGVVVRDLELMERFYGEVLGCRPVHRSRIPASVGVPAGLGDELLVVWLQVPSGGCVKLIQPRSSPSPAPPVLPLTARRGLSYLTFHLDDMDPVVAALAAGGARPLSDPVVVWARGRRISFWADPEGNALELADERGGVRGAGRSEA
ncbi:catechol 2,3-dioxygenase-like lactoylglutathione lyase family enzyme [Streptomyces sp. LBL]|uniref:VOC family protein n=1 Tax=Streptomyces sp. LBL TaxID=2940562 RepID=UPI0024735D65|nr:VOC family protein [Streptomyces sp. LBL]MDH6626170.1 catechol 2,3-dioxygenase-like lactoylglutathione lyase family enzyme [Streptomyces sp. LBL]